jgi:hypothetical protein
MVVTRNNKKDDVAHLSTRCSIWILRIPGQNRTNADIENLFIDCTNFVDECSGKSVINFSFQFDSPGYTASYCFYSLMLADRRVLAFYVATKSMVNYSTLMGKIFFFLTLAF